MRLPVPPPRRRVQCGERLDSTVAGLIDSRINLPFFAAGDLPFQELSFSSARRRRPHSRFPLRNSSNRHVRSGISIARLEHVPSTAGLYESERGNGRPHVLVVDNDQTARELVSRAIEKAGYRPVTASCALDGLRLAPALSPEAIVVDLVMPGMDGWAFIEAIKNDSVLRDVPVIVVSILDERQRSLSIGAVDHLLKPVVADQLIGALQAAVAQRKELTTP